MFSIKSLLVCLKKIVCPIVRGEGRRWGFLTLLSFLVGCNYVLLKAIKDPLIISGADAGASIIPFIKVWGILPAAIILTYIFGFLSCRYKRSTVFNIFISSFVLFFILFVAVLYPNRELIHLTSLASFLSSVLPKGLNGLIAMIKFWDLSLCYIVCELWSSAVLSMLFWGIINEIVSVSEACRLYPVLNLGLNFAGVLAGYFSVWCASQKIVCISQDNWYNVILMTMSIVIIVSFLIMFIYGRYFAAEHNMASNVNKPSKIVSSETSVKKTESKSMLKMFDFILRHKYLMCLSVIVMSYNLVIHLLEVVWKEQIHSIYPNPSDFLGYMGKISLFTAIVSILASLIASGLFIKKFGWIVSGLITPVLLFICSSVFFIFIKTSNVGMGVYVSSLLGTSPFVLIAFCGAILNIFARASKYTFFDITKEMAFVPLSSDEKTFGKATIDGVMSRLGKSGGSIIYQILLLFCSSITASINIIALAIFVIFVLWYFSVCYVGKRFNDLSIKAENKSLEVDVEPDLTMSHIAP